MRKLAFLSIISWSISCSQPLKDQKHLDIDKTLGVPENFEFSYTDSYNEILSLQVDSTKSFLLSKNDSLQHGTMPDSLIHKFFLWQSEIMLNPENYRQLTGCESCAELAIKIITDRDTILFVKHGEMNNKTKEMISATRNLYDPMANKQIGNAIFETRSLIKPKPPVILPVKF